MVLTAIQKQIIELLDFRIADYEKQSESLAIQRDKVILLRQMYEREKYDFLEALKNNNEAEHKADQSA